MIIIRIGIIIIVVIVFVIVIVIIIIRGSSIISIIFMSPADKDMEQGHA